MNILGVDFGWGLHSYAASNFTPDLAKIEPSMSYSAEGVDLW
jgi:hypothetical protein